MNKVYFKEEQRFRQLWIWLIILLSVIGSLVFITLGVNQQLINGEPFGDRPMTDLGLIVFSFFLLVFVGVLTMLFLNMRLITEVRSDGFWFRFPPFIRKFKSFHRDEIDRFEMRNYNPIREYGGWGIRMGSKKFGRAYNVQGNLGLQLYLKNGSKVLFGTQRKEALRDAMTKIMSTGEGGSVN